MKIVVCMMIGIAMAATVVAQQKPTELDKSPLDVSYFPPNYPILKMGGKAIGTPAARILYSRPQKKGRAIFGSEVKYNDVWRIGANESTEIEFFKNATFGNKKIAKGRYSLFCIPTEDKWTFILNKDLYSWGSFTYNSSNDVLRCEVPVQKTTEEVEAFTMYFENNGSSKLIIMWDTAKVSVPLTM